jgi:hypothetical protein
VKREIIVRRQWAYFYYDMARFRYRVEPGGEVTFNKERSNGRWRQIQNPSYIEELMKVVRGSKGWVGVDFSWK